MSTDNRVRSGAPALTRQRSVATDIVLRVLTAAGLAVDAYVHLLLAGRYGAASSGGIGEGFLFRAEAVAAIVVALLVLATGHRISYLLAFLVGLSALAAVLVYRYIDIPAFGPIPAMYEPLWFTKKAVSAVAEGATAVFAAAGFLATRRGRRLTDRATRAEGALVR